VGLIAQLSVTATTLPTGGLRRQPLSGVARAPETPKTAAPPPHVVQPRMVQQRVVRITTPKKTSPKTQEKLPYILPPLPSKIAISYS